MYLHALLLLLSVGGDPSASPQDTPIENSDGIEVTAEQLKDVKTRAKRAFAGEIERIYVGQLEHPAENVGFRVHFKDEIVGTYVIERQYVFDLTKDTRGQKGASPWDPIPIPPGLHTDIKRLFPLKKVQLHLNQPDGLSYRQVIALLQSIESGTYRVRKENQSTFNNLNEIIPISKIFFLMYDEQAKTIEIMTRENPCDGGLFKFVVQPDGFELVTATGWVT